MPNWVEVQDRIIKDAEMWTPVSIHAKPTFPDVRHELARTMGRKFSKVLRKWIGEINLQEVVNRNAANDDSCCASHDFCDANMAMDEAFTKVMGRGFEFNFDEDPAKEQDNASDTELMNMAWDYAKANKFFINTDVSANTTIITPNGTMDNPALDALKYIVSWGKDAPSQSLWAEMFNKSKSALKAINQ
jgi:hypothetical protein